MSFIKIILLRKLKLTLGFLLLNITIHAQARLIQGKIIDENTQESLIGVTVQDTLDKNYGTVTDANGHFQLKISKASSTVLKFSMIGYKSKLYSITAKDFDKPLLITLSVSSNALDEILVVGLSEAEEQIKEIKLNVNPVTVLSAKDIENRASNINELLARQAGIRIRQSGGAGSSSSVSIRGLEGKRVQIYLNGNPLNTPDGSFGINDLPLQLIERIEIYKGTVPAELGGDGLGSAVNVVLKHIDYSYIDASMETRSFGTVKSGLILKKTLEKAGIEFGVGGFLTQAENDYLMESPFQENLSLKRDHDFYRNILIGSGIKFHKLWFDEIEIETAYLNYFREIQGIQRNIQHATTTSTSPVVALNLDKEDFLIKNLKFKSHNVFVSFRGEMIDTSSYAYDWNGNQFKSLTGRGEIGIGPNELITKQKEFRSRQNFSYQVSNNLGFNLNNAYRKGNFNPKDDLANSVIGRNVYNWPASLSNNIIALTLEAKTSNNNFLSSAAIKHYHSKVNGYNTNIYLTQDPDEVSTTFNKLGYNLGFRLNITDELFLKSSHERALRLPNNQELFGDGVLITPAVNLKPEISYNFNVGLVFDKFRLPSGNRIQGEWNAFLMYVSDLIQLGGNGISTGYVNYAKAKIYGTDFEIKTDLTTNLYASINATFQRVLDNNQYIPGTQNVANPTYDLLIPNIPTSFANWNIEYHRSDLFGEHSNSRFIYEGSYTHQFNFGFAISEFDNLEIPSALTHNFIWEQSFSDNKWNITFEARNIFNALIINNWNQPLSGRNYSIRLRFLLINKEDKHQH